MSRLPGRLLTLSRALLNTPFRRKPVQVRRILVAHWLLLGDTILLAPLLAKIARHFPGAECVVLARPGVAALLSGKPYGCTVQSFDPRDSDSVRQVLANGSFDLAYVLGDNRYAWLARAAGARWIVGFGNDVPAWKNWMVDEAHALPSVPTAWADMAATLVPGAPPAPYCSGDWPAPEAAPFELPQAPYAVLHVGASSPLKLWPPERWMALAQQLEAAGILPVWSGGAGEGKWIDAADPAQRYPRYCGNLQLAQLWRLLEGARLLVCPDTGVAHMGRVVGVPTVALFGPGSPVLHGAGDFWADMPYRALTVNDFPCRDQQVIFRRQVPWVRRCGRGVPECRFDAACMSGIDLPQVAAAAFDMLKLASAPAGERCPQ